MIGVKPMVPFKAGDRVEIVVSTGYGTVTGIISHTQEPDWLGLEAGQNVRWVQISHIVTIVKVAS